MIDSTVIGEIAVGLWESFYMTILSTLFAYIIGLPLGIFMVVSDKGGIMPMPILNKILGIVINILRSVPFIILLVFLLPFTRVIVGTAIGSVPTIVPLVIASFPFVARLVESSIKELDAGIIEAAQSMGATNFQIITRVMIPESVPSLLNGVAIALTTILAYSAMSGIVGGGGLGKIAINEGYYRQKTEKMIIPVALLVILVQIFQEIGNKASKKSDKRIR
ncbi:MAG: methionine ABC transporter permease [Clostridia bacterium]